MSILSSRHLVMLKSRGCISRYVLWLTLCSNSLSWPKEINWIQKTREKAFSLFILAFFYIMSLGADTLEPWCTATLLCLLLFHLLCLDSTYSFAMPMFPIFLTWMWITKNFFFFFKCVWVSLKSFYPFVLMLLHTYCPL